MSHERTHLPPKGGASATDYPITIRGVQGVGSYIEINIPTLHKVDTTTSITLNGDGGASVSSKAVPPEGTPATVNTKITSIVLAGVELDSEPLKFKPKAGETPTVTIIFVHS